MSPDAFYSEIDSSSINDVDIFFPRKDERFQLLHHAIVYQALKGVLLVGDSTKLQYGVITHFSADLHSSYLAIMEFLFKNYVAQF